ncbi:hypothetical protein ACQKDY_15455 [Alteromonas macleodii]|nr:MULTISPECIES: hypothetical protein [Alteromonas]MEE3027285.1 hypothetical protein [Pseudomonadota bacterium]
MTAMNVKQTLDISNSRDRFRRLADGQFHGAGFLPLVKCGHFD